MDKSGDPLTLVQTFGKNVRRIRRAKDLSQEQLAERMDRHRTFVSYVERAVVTQRDIGLSHVELFARALEVTVAELLTPAGESKR